MSSSGERRYFNSPRRLPEIEAERSALGIAVLRPSNVILGSGIALLQLSNAIPDLGSAIPSLGIALLSLGNALLRPGIVLPGLSNALLRSSIAIPKLSNAISGGRIAFQSLKELATGAKFAAWNGKIAAFTAFHAFASRMRARISRTASESPVSTARAMTLWPMLNSVISGMAATSPTLR